MLNRIHWVLETYARRPLVLAFFGLAAVGFALNYAISGLPNSSYRTTNYPSFPQATLVIQSKSTLEAIRQAGMQSEVDAINLGSLWNEMAPKGEIWDEKLQRNVRCMDLIPGDDFYQILNEFPNLRQVLGVYGAPCDARIFSKLNKLEYLMVHGVELNHVESLKALSNLKRLDFDVVKPVVGFESLRELPKLEMIVFTSRLAVGDEVLKTVASFPHLKTLVLQFSNMPVPPGWPKDREFDDGMPPITEVGLGALAAAQQLDAIYFGGFVPRHDEENMLKLLRKSRAAVYPAVVDKERIPHYFLAVLPAILFSIRLARS